jgi:hypothetical protein
VTPAFKEWSIIVEALGAGEQILILRKGGIAEGPGGFQPRTARFWLFPTRFHQQQEKTKPAAAIRNRVFSEADHSGAPVTLRYFAELVHSVFLTDWGAISRLDPCHFWTEPAVRERFEWRQPAGVHVLIVRVYKIDTPIPLSPTPEMGGCKSWIEVPCAFDAQRFSPVVPDDAFRARIAALSL